MIENWSPDYDKIIDKLNNKNSKTRLVLYSELIDRYNTYSSFYIEKQLIEDKKSIQIDNSYKNNREIEYNKKIQELEQLILDNPAVIEEIDIEKQLKLAEEKELKEQQQKEKQLKLKAISNIQKNYYKLVDKKFIVKEQELGEFFKPNKEFYTIEYSDILIKKLMPRQKEAYEESISEGGLKTQENNDILIDFLTTNLNDKNIKDLRQAQVETTINDDLDNSNVESSTEVSTAAPQVVKQTQEKSKDKINSQFSIKDYEEEQAVIRNKKNYELQLQAKGDYNNLIKANIKEIKINDAPKEKIHKLFENWNEKHFDDAKNKTKAIYDSINKIVSKTLKESNIKLNNIKILKITVDGWFINDVQLSPASDNGLGMNNNVAWNWNFEAFQKAKNLEALIMDESSYISFQETLDFKNKQESEFNNALNYLFNKFNRLDYVQIQPQTPINRSLWKNLKEEKELQEKINTLDNRLKTIEYAKAMGIGLSNANQNDANIEPSFGQLLGYMFIGKICEMISGGSYGYNGMGSRGMNTGMLNGLLGGGRSIGMNRYNRSRNMRSNLGKRGFF